MCMTLAYTTKKESILHFVPNILNANAAITQTDNEVIFRSVPKCFSLELITKQTTHSINLPQIGQNLSKFGVHVVISLRTFKIWSYDLSEVSEFFQVLSNFEMKLVIKVNKNTHFIQKFQFTIQWTLVHSNVKMDTGSLYSIDITAGVTSTSSHKDNKNDNDNFEPDIEIISALRRVSPRVMNFPHLFAPFSCVCFIQFRLANWKKCDWCIAFRFIGKESHDVEHWTICRIFDTCHSIVDGIQQRSQSKWNRSNNSRSSIMALYSTHFA